MLVDERYVPPDDPQSNAAMIERTLFARGVPERWLRFKTERNDPAETARVFDEEWRALGIAAPIASTMRDVAARSTGMVSVTRH